MIQNGEPDDLLTECANSRRSAWLNTTNELSQANIKRLYGTGVEADASREAFFEKLKNDANFPAVVRAGFDKMIPEDFEGKPE